MATLLVLLFSPFFGQAFAQDSGALGAKDTGASSEIDRRIFQILDETRASKMDIGLIRLQQMLEPVFAVNRPAMFQRGHFYHFEVSFVPIISTIQVGAAYKSKMRKAEDLVSECQDDIEIALGAMTFTTVPKLAADSAEQRSALLCKINSLFVNSSTPEAEKERIFNPGWSACNSVRLNFDIESEDGSTHVSCGRYLSESKNDVHVE